MNMREKMARAICAANRINPDQRSIGIGHVMPAGQEYALWEAQLPNVDAALETLLVPTEAMIMAAQNWPDKVTLLDIWQPMIRAAKADHQDKTCYEILANPNSHTDAEVDAAEIAADYYSRM